MESRLKSQDRSGYRIVEEELIANQAWLIRLRWWAGFGILAATWLTTSVLSLPLPAFPCYAVGVAILVCNIFLLAIHNFRLMAVPRTVEPFEWLASSQIGLDWFATILLIHYSGGVESPVILFFFFHIIIASILRSALQTYIYAAVATLLVGGMAGLEYMRAVPHYGIIGFVDAPLYRNPLFIAGEMVFFVSGIFGVAYTASTLNGRLRQRETEIVILSDRLQSAYLRLQTLYEGMQAVNSTLDLQQVLDSVARSTTEVMGARGCSIRLLDKAGEKLILAAVYGLSESYMLKGDLLLEHNALAREVLQGRTVAVGNVLLEDRLQYGTEAVAEGIRSTLSARLQGKREVLGMIRAYSTQENYFTEDDITFLTAIANQGSLAIENAMAFRELEQLDDIKSKFMLMITHELRSPVSVVRSLLRTITAGYAGASTEQQADLIARALHRVDFLQFLIDDLLDLAAGKEPQNDGALIDISLTEAVERVVAQFEVSAREKNIELKWMCTSPEALPIVSATSEDIDRILNNLLSNAVKYTPGGGTVTVTVRRGEAYAHIKVIDTGIGIPEESLPHLFTEFYRAPNAKAQVKEGTGLGMAITKNLVNRLGGRIGVKSGPGSGATFTVLLPLAFAGEKKNPCKYGNE